MDVFREIEKKINKLILNDRLEICEKLAGQLSFDNKSILSFEGKKYNIKKFELSLIAFYSGVIENNPLYNQKDKGKWIESTTKFIRNQEYITKTNLKNDMEKVMTLLAFQQFPTQKDQRILNYRYQYIYNFKNSKCRINISNFCRVIKEGKQV